MRKVKWAPVILWLCLSAIAQSGMSHSFRIWGIEPDFVVAGGILLSLGGSALLAMKICMVAGVVRDAMSGGPFGVSMLTMGMFGLLAGHVLSNCERIDFAVAAPAVFLQTCGMLTVSFLIYKLWGIDLPSFGHAVLRVIIPCTFYTSLACLFLFWLRTKTPGKLKRKGR